MNANFVTRNALGLTAALSIVAAVGHAATQGTLPVLTTAPRQGAATAKASVSSEQWAALLEQACPDNPALLSAVIALMNESRSGGKSDKNRNPALLIVSYRNDPKGVRDLVVQVCGDSAEELSGVLNPRGTVRSRLGDELFGSADGFLGLIYQQVSYLGEQAEVQRQQRAMASTIAGDLTLLREQTVDPLHVVAVMPQASQYLPGSLKSRVKSVVVNAELTFGEWRGKIGLVTADERTAEQVGYTVAAWREMAVSMADTFASYSSAKPLREALNKSTVEVSGNQVLAAVAIPSDTAVRVVKEASGHGGGCPPGGALCASTKVAICHKASGSPDRTICVAPSAVAAHLAHGDTCGACPDEKFSICHKGRTIQVDAAAISAHLAHGDILGPCP